MLTNEELKQKACAAIDRRKKEIIGVSQEILSHPEAGFREVRTSSLVARKFDEMGIEHRSGLAITGVKGRIAGGAG
ncbi:MAG: amidohydrolase, partial [Chloroflexi bacterium]|nr:amidohydrolase [Chloroflexota bacterium]